MKKTLLSLAILMTGLFSFGQTAANFNCNDCASVNHDLFSELNSGKVVVICWIMPCSSCISGALAAQSACQSFSTSNPGQVYYYVADDYGTTQCGSISSWCTSNGVNNVTAKFSNPAIDMLSYGSTGMPKVVVLGGANHGVYYNANNTAITTSGIQGGISAALAAIASGVEEKSNSVLSAMNVFPNPSSNSSKLSFSLTRNAKVSIDVENLLGQKVAHVFNGDLQTGDNTINVNTSELSNGNYFINVTAGDVSKKIKLVIAR